MNELLAWIGEHGLLMPIYVVSSFVICSCWAVLYLDRRCHVRTCQAIAYCLVSVGYGFVLYAFLIGKGWPVKWPEVIGTFGWAMFSVIAVYFNAAELAKYRHLRAWI